MCRRRRSVTPHLLRHHRRRRSLRLGSNFSWPPARQRLSLARPGVPRGTTTRRLLSRTRARTPRGSLEYALYAPGPAFESLGRFRFSVYFIYFFFFSFFTAFEKDDYLHRPPRSNPVVPVYHTTTHSKRKTRV